VQNDVQLFDHKRSMDQSVTGQTATDWYTRHPGTVIVPCSSTVCHQRRRQPSVDTHTFVACRRDL